MRIPGLESPIAVTGLVLAGLVLGGAGPAATQDWQGPAAFALRVTDEKGEPIAAARVLAQTSEAGAGGGPEAVTTDALGQAVLSGLREGEWYVEVSHPAYMLYAAYLDLRAGKKPQVGFSSQVNTETSWQPMTVKFLKASPDLRRGATTRERAEPEPPEVVRETPAAAAAPPEPPKVVRPEETEVDATAGAETETQPTETQPTETPATGIPATEAEEETVEPAGGGERQAEQPEAKPAPTAPVEPAETADAPAGEAPVEEQAIEASPAEEMPAEESAERASVEEELIEETPADETPVGGMASAEPPTQETVAQEAPAEEIAVEEAPAETAPEPETAALETPIPEAPTPETPMPETRAEGTAPSETAQETATGDEVAAAEAPVEPEPAERPQTPPIAPTAGDVLPGEPIDPPLGEGDEIEEAGSETPAAAPSESEAIEPGEVTAAADEETAAAMPSPEPGVEARQAKPPPPAPSAEPPPTGAAGTPRLPAYLRSAAAGNCPECESGEWAVASEQEAGRAGELRSEQQCSEAFVDGAARAARLLADTPGARLAGYVGPVLPAMWRLDPDRRDEVEELLVPRTDPASHCQLAGVVLPSGAEFTGYVLEAWDVLGGRSCLAGFDCAVGQSRWLAEPVVLRGTERTVVYGIFKNRSTRRERRARMTIYFRPPDRDWRPASR